MDTQNETATPKEPPMMIEWTGAYTTPDTVITVSGETGHKERKGKIFLPPHNYEELQRWVDIIKNNKHAVDINVHTIGMAEIEEIKQRQPAKTPPGSEADRRDHRPGGRLRRGDEEGATRQMND